MTTKTDTGFCLPGLPLEQYTALKADIEKRGIIVPIVLDAKTGEVVDGAHRKRIATELGIDCPEEPWEFASDEVREETALVLNMLRRQMDSRTWARCYREVCSLRGVGLGQGSRNDRRTSDNLSEVTPESIAKELGVAPRTARRRVEVAEILNELGNEDLLVAYEQGEASDDAVRHEARKRQKAARVEAKHQEVANAAKKQNLPKGVEIITGDFRKVKLSGDSIDLIFTDPPYDRESLGVYGDLAKFASRVLRPGGSLVTYAGAYLLPDIFHQLLKGGYLNYQWMFVLLHTGHQAHMFTRGVSVGYKPLIWLTKGKLDPTGLEIKDVVESTPPDKSLHDWAQSETEALYYIEKLSAGGVVLDPFCGSGTTLVAARQLGRPCVGIEIDAEKADVARGRLVQN
jgi:hypothetical protein